MGLDSADPDFPLMLESGLPIMVVDCQAIGERVGFVMSDDIDGMEIAVRHLYTLGRRRIATITGLMRTRPAIDRLLGYRSELDRLGLEQRPEYVVESDFTPGSGYEQMKRLLALPEPPDAVAAVSDLTAVGAIVAIEEIGLRVPEDIAVVGFGDSPFAPVMRPALTTVHPNALEIGMAAADGILAMLDRPGDPPPAIILPVELVVRESCGIELLQQDAYAERSAS
jgi:LacI family transcriptional regulator